MSKVEELIAESKLNELLKKKDDEKVKKTVIWVLAIVGAVAAVAAIAYECKNCKAGYEAGSRG